MMDPTDKDAKFEYDGRLVFNGLYIESDGEVPFDNKDELLSELPTYTEGTPSHEGKGFSDLQLEAWADRYDDLPPALETVAERTWDLQFTKEVYDSTEDVVDNEGDEITAWVHDDWSVYVYWYPDNFLLIQAAQGKIDEVEKQLFPVIGRSNFESDKKTGENPDPNGDGDRREELPPFDSEFLKWLVWKADTKGGVSQLKIPKLSDAVMSGSLSNFGRTNEVSESRDITSSHPIIAGILEDRSFEEIEGVFEVNDIKVDAQIYADGSIRVMAQEDIGDSSQYKRVLMANLFLQRVMDLYLDWREMDPSEKYVDPEYFHTLHKKAKNMPNSANYDFEFDSLVTRYANLRNEDPSNYSFSFDI